MVMSIVHKYPHTLEKLEVFLNCLLLIYINGIMLFQTKSIVPTNLYNVN